MTAVDQQVWNALVGQLEDSQVTLDPVHEVRDGKECHFFEKQVQFGVPRWICECGEVRDRFGRTLE